MHLVNLIIICLKETLKKMSEIDAVISKCVDEIWTKYDDDGNGFLDKDETKRFVKDTLQDMTEGGGF